MSQEMGLGFEFVPPARTRTFSTGEESSRVPVFRSFTSTSPEFASVAATLVFPTIRSDRVRGDSESIDLRLTSHPKAAWVDSNSNKSIMAAERLAKKMPPCNNEGGFRISGEGPFKPLYLQEQDTGLLDGNIIKIKRQ